MSADPQRRGPPSSARGGQRPLPPTSPRPRIGWRLVLFFIGLLILNIVLGTRATQAPSRVRVPYSPFFLQQVQNGNVQAITSKGTAIQAELRQKEPYGKSKPTTKIKTEIPA